MPLAPTNRALAGRLDADGDELLAALLDSTVDGVYAVDGRGRVLFANSAALAILGYDEAELLGRNSHATIHHLHRDGRPLPETECPLLAPRVSGEAVLTPVLDTLIARSHVEPELNDTRTSAQGSLRSYSTSSSGAKRWGVGLTERLLSA